MHIYIQSNQRIIFKTKRAEKLSFLEGEEYGN